MKKITSLVLLLSLASFISCQAVKDADDVANIQGGRCSLSKIGPGDIMCFDFVSGYNANQGSADCDSLYSTYVSSDGVNGRDWLSGDANACSTSSSVGTCTTTKGVMYYYSSYWNAGSAQTDCTSDLSGTWAP